MKPRATSRAGTLVVLVLAAGLAACGQRALYSKLDERDANEQVALLRMAGIDASKEARDNAFTVSVRDTDMARATLLLKEHGLPRRQYESRSTIFKREGFVTSPAQEHELSMGAKEQAINRSLAQFVEVVDSNVVLDIPEKSPLVDKAPPPRASVVVLLRPGVDVDEVKSRMRRSVVASVNGLTHDNVAIEHSIAQPPSPALSAANGNGAPGWLASLPWPLALAFGLGFASLAAALLVAWRHGRLPFAKAGTDGHALQHDTRDGMRRVPSHHEATPRGAAS